MKPAAVIHSAKKVFVRFKLVILPCVGIAAVAWLCRWCYTAGAEAGGKERLAAAFEAEKLVTARTSKEKVEEYRYRNAKWGEETQLWLDRAAFKWSAREWEKLCKDLQAKVGEMKTTLAELDQNIQRDEKLRTLAQESTGLMMQIQSEKIKELEATKERAKPPTDEETLAAYRASGIQGVPHDVSKVIIDRALARWPNNAGLANSTIGNVASAWFLLQDLKTKPLRNIPPRIRDQIVADAELKNGNDYEDIVREVNEQAGAYEAVEKLSLTGRPGEPIAQTRARIEKAKAQWGTNWKMVAFDLAN